VDIEKVKNSIPAENLSGDVALRKAVEFVKANAIVK